MKFIIAGFFSCLICFSSLISSAETEKTNDQFRKIGLNSGLYNYASIDELYSPAIFAGKGPAYGFKFLNGNEKKHHQLSLRLAFIERNRKSISFGTAYFSPTDFNIVKNGLFFESVDNYRFLIPDISGTTFKVFAEGTWLTTVNVTTSAGSLPELIQSGLAAGAFAEKKIKRHRLKAALSVPVITWTVRNNYSMSLTQNYEKLSKLAFIVHNSQLQFLNTLMAMNTCLEYEYNISKNFSIEGEYNFRYMNNTSPRQLKAVTGIYSVNFFYSF